MRLLVLISLALMLNGCFLFVGLKENSEKEYRREIDEMKIEATVSREQFINKGGKVVDGVYDYYLSYGGEKKFVKFIESEISVDDLIPHIGNTATFSISERHGLWDTDDPEVQSRVGDYVVIWKIHDN